MKKLLLNLGGRTIIQERCRYEYAMKSIADELDRNVSTISREIDSKPPNGVGKYIADVARRRDLKKI
jgi:IS30 family transposase